MKSALFIAPFIVAFFLVNARAEVKFFFPQMSEYAFSDRATMVGGNACGAFLSVVASSPTQDDDILVEALKKTYSNSNSAKLTLGHVVDHFQEFGDLVLDHPAIESRIQSMDKNKRRVFEKRFFVFKSFKDRYIGDDGNLATDFEPSYYPDLRVLIEEEKFDVVTLGKAIGRLHEDHLDALISELYIVDVIYGKYMEVVDEDSVKFIPTEFYPEIQRSLAERLSDESSSNQVLHHVRTVVGSLTKSKLEDLANRLFIMQELEKQKDGLLAKSVSHYYPVFDENNKPNTLREIATQVAGFDSDQIDLLASSIHLGNLVEQKERGTDWPASFIAGIEGDNDFGNSFGIARFIRGLSRDDVFRLIEEIETSTAPKYSQLPTDSDTR